jgi:quercetin dioxygenase-like cupin family protein
MSFVIAAGHFSSEPEAIAEIEARGWHALTLTAPAEVSEWHWHDFDAVIYVLEGDARVEFEDGSHAIQCGVGARIDAPRETVHREITDGYRAVFGFSVDPAQLTEPINKPVGLLV